jgi:hypothetical protein
VITEDGTAGWQWTGKKTFREAVAEAMKRHA